MSKNEKIVHELNEWNEKNLYRSQKYYQRIFLRPAYDAGLMDNGGEISEIRQNWRMNEITCRMASGVMEGEKTDTIRQNERCFFSVKNYRYKPILLLAIHG